MVTMIDKYLATEMFKFNALSQLIIALFIHHGGWTCGQTIQGRGHKLMDKAKAGQSQRPRPINLTLRPRPRISIPDYQYDSHSNILTTVA